MKKAFVLAQIDPSILVNRWGVGGFFVFVAGLFIWKWILPRVDAYIAYRRKLQDEAAEQSRVRDEQFVQVISNNLTAERTRGEKERDKFIEVLDGTLRKQSEILSGLPGAVAELVRRSGGRTK